jgi:hypothetical protein
MAGTNCTARLAQLVTASAAVVAAIVCVLLIAPAGATAAAPAFVQQVSSHSPGVTEAAVTPTANITSGNRLVVHVVLWSSAGAAAKSVTDSAGNTYVELLHLEASENTEMSVWSARIDAGGGTRPTITVTPTSRADVDVAVSEYSGLSEAADALAVDQTAQATGITSGDANVTSGGTALTSAPTPTPTGESTPTPTADPTARPTGTPSPTPSPTGASSPTPTPSVSGGPLCSPGPCTRGTTQNFNVTTDDGAGVTVTRGYQVCRPTNLVNSAAHPVPLIFGFLNNQQWAGEGGYIGCSGPQWDCATFQCVYVQMLNPHSNGYTTPTTAPGVGAKTCGSSGTAQCDDIPAVVSILNAVMCSNGPACQNVDPNRVYFTGGSTGGAMTEDVMCDPRTSPFGRGYSVVSASLLDFTASNPPQPPSCPAILGSNPNRNQSLLWIYGTADGIYHAGLDTGYWDSVTPPRWHYGNPELVTSVLGSRLGCPSTPTTSQTVGDTGKWTYDVFAPCATQGVATGYYRGLGAGHIPEGYDGLDLAQAAWTFFSANPG